MTTRHIRRRAGFFALIAALAVLAMGAAIWFAVQTQLMRGGNTALAEPDATAEVTDEIGDAVKAVFTYNYEDPERSQRAAERLLVGEAVDQYDTAFDEVRDSADEKELVRSSTVRVAGVQELQDDDAQMLVLVDQQTRRNDIEAQESSTVFLDIEAERVDGEWKIVSMREL